MIHEQLKEAVKEAMKAKDAARVSAIRNILAAFTNEAVTLGNKPDELLPDEAAIKVLSRLAKQRRESIAQYREGGREEQAAAEEKELALIETYLPEQMSEDDIRRIAEQKKEELGVTDKSNMGKLIGAVMQEVKGQADGGTVKRIVSDILS